MAEFNDMQTALDARLATSYGGVGETPVAWPNNEYSPSGVVYLRPTFLPSNTLQAGMSASGLDETNGVYQVDVFTPKGAGRSQIADDVADLFKRGTVLTASSVKMRIRSVSIGASRDDGAYYITPIEINWQTYTEPR